MTDQPKWTPGPWNVVESDIAPRWWIVQDPETWVNRIAAVPAYALHADGTDCDSKANAHLIAAAPELYAALEALLHYEIAIVGPFAGQKSEAARAALAKARGQA